MVLKSVRIKNFRGGGEVIPDFPILTDLILSCLILFCFEIVSCSFICLYIVSFCCYICILSDFLILLVCLSFGVIWRKIKKKVLDKAYWAFLLEEIFQR